MPPSLIRWISDRLNNSEAVTGMFWDAHILAGGQARRLGGQDKGALVVGDRRILDRQLAALDGRAARIVLVGGPERHVGAGVEVIPDRLPGIGALGGLYTALVSATSERTLVHRVRHAVRHRRVPRVPRDEPAATAMPPCRATATACIRSAPRTRGRRRPRSGVRLTRECERSATPSTRCGST